MYKLTVYVPESHLEALKEALFEAGAGAYNGYDRCCWQVKGMGQFRPLPGSKPFAGEEGACASVEEWRMEMVCADEAAARVKAALLAVHPYEVPAYDFVRVEDI